MTIDENKYEPFDVAITMFYSGQRPDVVLRLYRLGAKSGDALAQYALASIYLHGNQILKIRPSVRRALPLLKAAAITQCRAMFELGILYANGIGVRQNQPRAFELFECAAKHGSLHAKIEVARRLAEGDGTRRNMRRSQQIYRSTIRAIELMNRLHSLAGHDPYPPRNPDGSVGPRT
jgi:TPR repeat protein